MHVENFAIFDTQFESKDFESAISSAEPEAKNSLSQVVAVGAVCNAATFNTDTASSSEVEKSGGKMIVGNATGRRFYISIPSDLFTGLFVQMLRFCASQTR